MSLLIRFLIGSAVGSFLNVLAVRYKAEKSLLNKDIVFGRSRCPYCRKELAWFELIPIFSFLVQGGRCRICRHKLSWRYPFVEILSGLIFVFLPDYLIRFYHFVYPLTFAEYLIIFLWVLIFFVWLLIALIDWRQMVIPESLNVVLAVLGAVIAAIIGFSEQISPLFKDSFLEHYRLVFSPFENFFLNRFLGLISVAGFFSLIIYFSRGRGMGWGDVKLAAASGLALGWPDIGLAAIVSFLIGGIWALFLLLMKKKSWQSVIPFGPIFITAIVITFFWGKDLLDAYLALFYF